MKRMERIYAEWVLLMQAAALALLTLPGARAQEAKTIVYKFDVKEMIAPAIWRQMQAAFAEAETMGAGVIILHMNTYGGMLVEADSIRSRILRSKIPVHVFIDNNAASAGALIAIACDSIYMAPGASIGAATVVDQAGTKMPDKYQSYMRATMRSTAEAKGRDPDIAEAMVDESVAVAGLIDSSHVLTFSTKEAIENGFCEGEAASIEDALRMAGVVNYTLVTYRPETVERIIAFLLNPVLSSILIMVIIGGIYFELQTPGVGFPLIAAVTAAVLYFAPLYLEGLAENWEIIVFLAGLILLLVEVFVIPGFGVAGIGGIACIVVSLTLSLVKNVGFDFDLTGTDEVLRSLALVVISFTLAIGGSIYLSKKLLTGSVLGRYVLNETLAGAATAGGTRQATAADGLSGMTGIAFTAMRPAGKVAIGDEIYDAIARTGFIEKGTAVLVVDHEAAQVIVEAASVNAPSPPPSTAVGLPKAVSPSPTGEGRPIV